MNPSKIHELTRSVFSIVGKVFAALVVFIAAGYS